VKLPTNIRTVTTDKTVQMYKWRDASGVMQFSSTPPPDGNAQIMQLTPNLSTMQAVKPRPEEEIASAPAASPMPASPYTPGGMKKLMDQAGAVKQLMEQQQAQQQKSLEQITGTR
jgi:hypothetical protein